MPFYWPFNLLLLLMNKALRSQRAAGWRKERGWKARGWFSGLGRQGGLRSDAGGGLAGPQAQNFGARRGGVQTPVREDDAAQPRAQRVAGRAVRVAVNEHGRARGGEQGAGGVGIDIGPLIHCLLAGAALAAHVARDGLPLGQGAGQKLPLPGGLAHLLAKLLVGRVIQAQGRQK